MKYKIENLEKLNRFGQVLAKALKKGDLISLIGDLGAGKTSLVQATLRHMGVDDYVTSPTFSIVNIYDGDFRFYHLDLYRFENDYEIEDLDYETYIYPDGISFIEWAEKAIDYLPEDMIEIKIEKSGSGRQVEIGGNTERAEEIREYLDENFSC